MDNIVCVEISLHSDGFALGQILRDHEDVRVDLAQFVPIGDQFVPYVWVETDDQAAFEEHVRADERVTDLTALDSAEKRTLYKIEWADPEDEVMAAIAAHDLVIENATGTTDRWRFRLRGPDRENLAAFQQTLLEQDIPMYIHRIWQPDGPKTTSYGLTEVQRETLELAYREGYFGVPRSASLEDLGGMLDVSHQSVSRRVRVGVANLLKGTLVDDRPDESDEASKERV